MGIGNFWNTKYFIYIYGGYMSSIPILNYNMMSMAMPMSMPMPMPMPMPSLFCPPMPMFNPMMMNPFMNFNNNVSNNGNKAVQGSGEKSQGIKISKPGSECNLGSVSLSDEELKEIGFKSSDQRKRWSKLTSETQRALIELGKFAKEKGIDMTIISSWRSYSEQASLAKRKPGIAAKAGSSPHQRGLAVDIRVNGNRSKNLAILGAKWESMGYTWGKNWKGWTPEDWHFDTRKKRA